MITRFQVPDLARLFAVDGALQLVTRDGTSLDVQMDERCMSADLDIQAGDEDMFVSGADGKPKVRYESYEFTLVVRGRLVQAQDGTWYTFTAGKS